jgi:putative endonuclease
MPHRQAIGRKGEDLAAVFLAEKGFRILARNWRCRAGEIDLIAEKDGRVHFVEVKTRQTRTYGYPEEAVTQKKLQHFAHAVEFWLRGVAPSVPFQLDVLAIFFEPNHRPQIEWFQAVL